VDKARASYYDLLRQELESALSGRSERLKFDEKEELRKIFGPSFRDILPSYVPDKRFYITRFEKAGAVKWLKVPPMTQHNGR